MPKNKKRPKRKAFKARKNFRKSTGTAGKQKRRSSRLAGFCAILAHTCIHGTIFSSFYPDFTVGFGIGKRLTESATEEPPSFSGYTAGGETNPALKEKTKQRSESVQTRHVQILTAATRGAIFNKRQTPTAQSALNIERSIQHPEFCIQHLAFILSSAVEENPGCAKNAHPDENLKNYSRISLTTPEPTVLPPSRIAKRRPFSIAIGVMSSTVISTWSPGLHISTPSGRVITPVTSVVLK